MTSVGTLGWREPNEIRQGRNGSFPFIDDYSEDASDALLARGRI
jgi:hypothetical protein